MFGIVLMSNKTLKMVLFLSKEKAYTEIQKKYGRSFNSNTIEQNRLGF